jgi:putative NADH-flavin reductase
MKITVFGATGGVGGQVVRQALDAGHAVTAVVRDAARLQVEHPALEVVTVAGLTEPESLLPALHGSDVALSGVGPRSRKDTTVASTATQGILRAMADSGVRRFVAVSAVPVAPTPPDDTFVSRRIFYPLIKSIFRDIYADLALMEARIRDGGDAWGLDWTVVRPPRLTNRPLTGGYRTVIGANVSRGNFISRADVAHAMLAALADPRTVRQPIGVAN